MIFEWGLIKSSGVLDEMVPDEEEQRTIRAFFICHYTELSDVYKFYSAVNSGGGTHTLEYIEFSKFLSEADIIDVGNHSNVALKIFIESHVKGEEGKGGGGGGGGAGGRVASIHSEIHQHEFFISLIKLATFKYIVLAKKKVAMLRRKGHEASISKASTPTLFQAIEILYHDSLKPVIDKILTGVSMKATLGSDEVLLLFHENLDNLAAAFCSYAESAEGSKVFDPNIDPDQTDDTPHGMVDIKQFMNFATDADFLGSVSESDDENEANISCDTEITLKDLRQ
eukprot:12219304-Ditylum_brightwellii.AAC.1